MNAKDEFYKYTEQLSTENRFCCDWIGLEKKFWEWPGSENHHHCQEGGLAEHTVEVVRYALHIARLVENKKPDLEIIIVAGLWHDYAKIWDYKQTGNPNYPYQREDDYYDKIYHLSGSCAEYTAVARKFGVKDSFIKEVQHCILSHHGHPDFGAVKRPKTVEALIVSQADMLSASYGDTAWINKISFQKS